MNHSIIIIRTESNQNTNDQKRVSRMVELGGSFPREGDVSRGLNSFVCLFASSFRIFQSLLRHLRHFISSFLIGSHLDSGKYHNNEGLLNWCQIGVALKQSWTRKPLNVNASDEILNGHYIVLMFMLLQRQSRGKILVFSAL